MKKYIFFIIVSFLLLIISLSVFARISLAQETSEDKVKKFGVAFPVVELGNCTSVSECRTYCEDQTHRDACVTFAKKKGFYKETEIDPKREALMQAAKTELGCTSEDSCKTICQQEANFEKCRAFAEKNGLESGQKNPGDKKILEKAKEILGCNSPESCKAICEQEVNRDRCSEFAKQTGLEGGKKHVGPGGCDSEESCKKYCNEHLNECGNKNRQNNNGVEQRNDPSSEDYCRSHPYECRRKEMKIENRRPNENKPSPSEDQRGEDKPREIIPVNEGERPPGEEIKGISTEIYFFTHIINYLLGK